MKGFCILALYWGYIGIMVNQKSPIYTLSYWDNGKQNGNYYSIIGPILQGTVLAASFWFGLRVQGGPRVRVRGFGRLGLGFLGGIGQNTVYICPTKALK